MTNDEILDALLQGKTSVACEDRVKLKSGGYSMLTKEELNGRPVIGKGHPNYYMHKTLDREKFLEAANAYMSGRGVSQKVASEMAGLSIPTFTKYMNILYTEGRLDGNYFKDNIGIEVTPKEEYMKSNDYILDRLTRER